MANVFGINIAQCGTLKAEAAEAGALRIKFGDSALDSLSIHMDYDRASIIADAINKAEAEWAHVVEVVQ